MKSYHVLMGITAVVMATSSSVVISKSLHSHNHAPVQARIDTTAKLPVEADVLGDIGDELVAHCDANGLKQTGDCAQQWAELSQIAGTSPDGLR